MIAVDASLCSGCRRCEVHCAFFHSGRVGRSGARVRVVKIEEQGIDMPVICRQCRERYCLRCPEKALSVGTQGQVVLSTTLCTGCGACEALCPIGAIECNQEIPHVCDLCGGEPRCVKACTLEAIRFEPGQTDRVSLEQFRVPAKGLDPERKRVQFVLDQTRSLREVWSTARRG